ncbi:MAG: hypothetical protein RR891_04335 [Clostridium sp.]
MFKKINFTTKLFTLFLILSGLACFIFNFSNTPTSKDVFNLCNNEGIFYEDLNGDGKSDTILLERTNDGLISQINLNDNITYSLDYDKDLQTLGELCDYWPIRISTPNITNSKFKDIVIQSSFHNKAIQHVFSWNKSKYSDLFCSTNNIVGINHNFDGETTKLFSGNFANDNIYINEYLYTDESLIEINFSETNLLPDIDTINDFICFIESVPCLPLNLPDYINPQIKGNDIQKLSSLFENSNSLTFQDGYFTNLPFNKDDSIKSNNWKLNFRVTSNLNYNDVNSITINLTTSIYENNHSLPPITSLTIN